MRITLFVAVFVLLGESSVRAEILRNIAVRGDALSGLYAISRVHEASTQMEDVRVYVMLTGEDLSGETLVLHIAAAPRPYRMFRDVVLWNLGDVLRDVESISISQDIVTIKGLSPEGTRECRYAFSFDEGRLSKDLNALGCEPQP